MANLPEPLDKLLHGLNVCEERSGFTAQPPRQNLPLPRELRDQIYGYLLRNEHVHDRSYGTRPQNQRGQVSNLPSLSYLQFAGSANVSSQTSEANSRDVGIAPTYKFRIDVLAINHDISEEALEVFRGKHFVVVSH